MALQYLAVVGQARKNLSVAFVGMVPVAAKLPACALYGFGVGNDEAVSVCLIVRRFEDRFIGGAAEAGITVGQRRGGAVARLFLA
jgi:hypothetical protein